MSMDGDTVWVFNGAGGQYPSGVFRTLDDAEAWIARESLTGCLTQYPVGISVLDWALAKGFFDPEPKPGRADKLADPAWVGRFSSASAPHYHYEGGSRPGANEDDQAR